MASDDDVMFQGKWFEGASMVQPYSAKVCTASLGLHGRLNRIVNTRLRQVKEQHHDTLKHAAGYLFLEGCLATISFPGWRQLEVPV